MAANDELQSCLYCGHVVHHRLAPSEHRFRYRLSWLYLDLDELESAVSKTCLLSRHRWAPASFHPRDHFGGRAEGVAELASSIRRWLADHLGSGPEGPIRLLTPLRHFGVYFSPLCLYYCFEGGSTRSALPGGLHSLVAEVTNTPWGEQHLYALGQANQLESKSDSMIGFEHEKQFHVSPFMGMRQRYRWRVGVPGDRLSVSIRSTEKSVHLFTTAMTLHRRPLCTSQLLRMLGRFPVAPWQMLSAIYFEAWRLWRKKVPYHAHP